MKATETLHNVGQSLWLDNITRDLLTSGTLKRYVDTLSITGLTYAQATYFGVNSLKFTNARGESVYVRYRIGPHAGEHYLTPAERKRGCPFGPDVNADVAKPQ
jgi:hypothetical protein